MNNLNLLISFTSLLLMSIGMVSISSAIMAVGFLMLGVQGIVNLMNLLNDFRHQWSVCKLYGSALLAWYGVGAFIGLSWGDHWALGMTDYRDYRDLFLAGLYLTLTANALLLVSSMEQRQWRGLIDKLSQSTEPVPFPIICVLVLLWFVLLDLVIDGRIGFRSLGENIGGGRLPIIETLVYQLSLPLIGYLGWLLGKKREDSKQMLSLLVVLFIPVISLVLLGQGRRELISHAATFVFLFHWARYGGLHMRQAMVAGLIVLPMLALGSVIFQSQRLDNPASFYYEDRNLIQGVGKAVKELDQNWDLVVDSQLTTFPQRMFIINYLKELIGSSEEPRFGYGSSSLSEVVMSIPNFIYPEKVEKTMELGGVGEMRNPDFGLPDLSDYANSLLSLSYMDFGWFGVVYAALLTLLIGSAFAVLGLVFRNELFCVILLSTLLINYMIAEKSFIIVSLSILRLLLVLGVITVLLSLVPNSRQLRDGQTSQRPGWHSIREGL